MVRVGASYKNHTIIYKIDDKRAEFIALFPPNNTSFSQRLHNASQLNTHCKSTDGWRMLSLTTHSDLARLQCTNVTQNIGQLVVRVGQEQMSADRESINLKPTLHCTAMGYTVIPNPATQILYICESNNIVYCIIVRIDEATSYKHWW